MKILIFLLKTEVQDNHINETCVMYICSEALLQYFKIIPMRQTSTFCLSVLILLNLLLYTNAA